FAISLSGLNCKLFANTSLFAFANKGFCAIIKFHNGEFQTGFHIDFHLAQFEKREVPIKFHKTYKFWQ
ncbi:MAG: hypothetical protein IIX25_01075, partial [Clostridia bacterium]|nr:hypothetical protein [Clostridia bacterium]